MEVASERREVKTRANVLIAFFHHLKLSNDQAIFSFFPCRGVIYNGNETFNIEPKRNTVSNI